MKTTIEGETRICAVAIFAELAVWRERPDLQALCVAALKHGDLDEKAVASVLPGLSARACENILRRLTHDRLVDGRHRLTERGEACASSGYAPAWEEGVYRFLVAEHELFGVHILDFERDPRSNPSGSTDLDAVPNGFAPPPRRMFVSAFDRDVRFSLGDVNRNAQCRIEPMPAAKLRWKIDLESGKNECIVEGRTQADSWPRAGEFRAVAESAPSDELTGLFAQWEPQWNAGLGWIAMKYDGAVGPDGREDFVRTRQYEQKHVGRFGEVEKVVVRDIPVGPAGPDDARAWAAAIAVARVKSADRYVTLGRWQAEWSDAVRNTRLAEWAEAAPDPATLATASGGAGEARTKWLLAAAIDLGATP